MSHRHSCLVAVLAAALSAASVHAQPVDSGKVAAAEALFREGRDLLDKGKLEAACEKLEESLRLDRAIGTMWHLGRCLEESGKTATAWAMFLEVAAEARRMGRERQAQAAAKRARALEPRLCRLRLRVEASPIDAVVTKVDGRELSRAGWGTPVPVDCGMHRIEAIRGEARDILNVEVNRPGKIVDVDVPLPVADDAVPERPVEPRPKKKKKSGPQWYGDWAGWGMVGGGVALGVVSGVFWARSGSLEDEAQQPGVDLRNRDAQLDRADNARLVSLIAGGAAAGLLSAGLIKLVVHEGDESHVMVTPTAGGAAAQLRIRF